VVAVSFGAYLFLHAQTQLPAYPGQVLLLSPILGEFAAQAKLELIKLQQSGDLAQIAGQLKINRTEAASSNPFTSGWRPFVGWTCGAGFAVQFVVGPLGEWASALAGHPVKFLQLDLGTMMPLLSGVLGL
jgi:hypothetical protein